MDGFSLVYGKKADMFFWSVVHPFTDSINEFDTEKLTDGMQSELFGIARYDRLFILERRPLPGYDSVGIYDETMIYSARLGQGNRTHYVLKIKTIGCTRIGKIRLYDNYKRSFVEITPNNTEMLYPFDVVPSDPDGTKSKDMYRFKFVVSKYPNFYPPLPTVHPPKPSKVSEGATLSVYPNPVAHGTPITIETNQQYEQSITQLYSTAGVLVLQKQNKGKGRLTLDIPSTLTPGTYVIVVIPREGSKLSQKIIVK
jgi:hypothetical protein